MPQNNIIYEYLHMYVYLHSSHLFKDQENKLINFLTFVILLLEYNLFHHLTKIFKNLQHKKFKLNLYMPLSSLIQN